MPITAVQLREQYRSHVTKARALVDKYAEAEEGLPPEESVKIDGLLGKADEFKAQLDLMARLEQGEDFLQKGVGPQVASVGWREAGPEEGLAQVDPKSWRTIEVDGLEYRYWVPEVTAVKGYEPAFEAYLRKGMGELGPQDRKTLSEGVDTAGGFLAPAETQGSILRKLATVAAIRPRARRITTSRDMVRWPKVNYTTDDKYTSGVRLTWTGETPSSSTVHRVTDPVFGVEDIPVHTSMASMPFTNDLLEDAAFDVMGLGTDLMGEAFGLGEDDVFINGSGINRPEGILTHPNASVIYTTAGGMYVKSGSAATITADGLIDLETQLPAQYERNSVFVMSKATKAVIRKLKSATENLYLYPYGTALGQFGPIPESLLGYPIVKDEFMPAVAADAFPIIFGDLTGYLIVDRVAFSIQALRELYAETNITLLLARRRVGGQLIESYRMRTHKMEA